MGVYNPSPALIGARNLGRVWAPQLVVSGIEAPYLGAIVDPALPVLGHDPYIPNSDYIVITRGRVCSVKSNATTSGYLGATATVPAYANTGYQIMTLANGSDGLVDVGGNSTDLKPMGFAEQQYFKSMPGQIQEFPSFTKQKLISLPYIQASNGAYGNMKPGDWVTAYYGSATNTAQVPNDIGKVVKWVPRHVYAQHQAAASGTVALTAATYPAFKPNLVFALNAGSAYTGAAPTAVYSNTSGCWTFTNFASTVTDVVYDWGQDADNRFGQVATFEAVGTAGGILTTPNKFRGWLEWVRDNFGVWAYPPLAVPRPYITIGTVGDTTGASFETPTQIGTNLWQLAHYPVVPMNQITVMIPSGFLYDPLTGASTAVSNYVLPLADATYFNDWTYGYNYIINPINGTVQLSSNVSVTGNVLKVQYSAETSFIDGKIYNPGIMGLTGGEYSGVPGTPAHLELAGVLADMHIMVF
jgi:hypothetical protein